MVAASALPAAGCLILATCGPATPPDPVVETADGERLRGAFLAGNPDVTVADRHWASQMQDVREWYEPVLKERYEDADARRTDLEQLAQIAMGFSTRGQFLAKLAWIQ